jgi:hypothetical protein
MLVTKRLPDFRPCRDISRIFAPRGCYTALIGSCVTDGSRPSIGDTFKGQTVHAKWREYFLVFFLGRSWLRVSLPDHSNFLILSTGCYFALAQIHLYWSVGRRSHCQTLCESFIVYAVHLAAAHLYVTTGARYFNSTYKVISLFPRHVSAHLHHLQVDLANWVFKIQSPFRSRIHSIKCCVYSVKCFHKIVKILQVYIRDDRTQLYL